MGYSLKTCLLFGSVVGAAAYVATPLVRRVILPIVKEAIEDAYTSLHVAYNGFCAKREVRGNVRSALKGASHKFKGLLSHLANDCDDETVIELIQNRCFTAASVKLAVAARVALKFPKKNLPQI